MNIHEETNRILSGVVTKECDNCGGDMEFLDYCYENGATWHCECEEEK